MAQLVTVFIGLLIPLLGFKCLDTKDFLAVRRKCVANRYFRLLNRFIDEAIAGSLPEACRWILVSQATFLTKPGTDVPRPIRAGEFLRRLVGKQILRRFGSRIKQVMLAAAQYGVSLPGGAETLIHCRDTFEQVAATGVLGAVAVIDADLVNCFGSFEWTSIREAISNRLPELSPWNNWCSQDVDSIRLPSGERVTSDRGVGQGEAEGPLKAALVIAETVDASQARIRADGIAEGVWFWFIDDGQLFVRPKYVDAVLRILDDELAKRGATRGAISRGDNVKSSVKCWIPCGHEADCSGWDTPYVRDTCRILDSHSDSKVLGVVLGSQLSRTAHFEAALSRAQALHEAIDSVGDAAVEVVLKSECAGVAKVVHILRATGDLLPLASLSSVDERLRVSLSTSLGGDVYGHAWSQAQCAFSQGGLGWTSAADLALPAFIASRVSARPAASSIFARFEAAGLGTAAAFQEVFDARLGDASARLIASLPADLAQRVEQIINTSREQAELRWQQDCGANPHIAPTALDPTAAEEKLTERRSQPHQRDRDLPGPEPDEPGSAGGAHTAAPLQRALVQLKGQARVRSLMECLRREQRQSDLARISELCNPEQTRSWLWSINKAVDP